MEHSVHTIFDITCTTPRLRERAKLQAGRLTSVRKLQNKNKKASLAKNGDGLGANEVTIGALQSTSSENGVTNDCGINDDFTSTCCTGTTVAFGGLAAVDPVNPVNNNCNVPQVLPSPTKQSPTSKKGAERKYSYNENSTTSSGSGEESNCRKEEDDDDGVGPNCYSASDLGSRTKSDQNGPKRTSSQKRHEQVQSPVGCGARIKFAADQDQDQDKDEEEEGQECETNFSATAITVRVGSGDDQSEAVELNEPSPTNSQHHGGTAGGMNLLKPGWAKRRNSKNKSLAPGSGTNNNRMHLTVTNACVKKASPVTTKRNVPSSSTTAEPSSAVKQYWEEKQRISLSRERKAARVLGIVMGR